MTWSCLGRQASNWGHKTSVTTKLNWSTFSSLHNSKHDHSSLMNSSPDSSNAKSIVERHKVARWMSTPSATRAMNKALDRDVIVSVLEASATRRDAKGYLHKYTSEKRKLYEADGRAVKDEAKGAVDVAVVKIRLPQELSSNTLCGIARTMSQLRVLGLISLIIVDCGAGADRQVFEDEALRLCEAIDSFGGLGAKLADHVFLERNPSLIESAECTPSKSMFVQDEGVLNKALQHGMIVVIPSIARQDDISVPTPAEANEAMLALTRYLAGSQIDFKRSESQMLPVQESRVEKIASVERIIILDPVGGTPMARRPDVSHRLINLEQEYDVLLKFLTAEKTSYCDSNDKLPAQDNHHAANLSLAKAALTFLPPSSSALITTPRAAANNGSETLQNLSDRTTRHPPLGFDDMVTTRKQKNPLLHNLLTNRPAFSPSLPLQRMSGERHGCLQNIAFGSATLVKRGMPVTIHPEPRVQQWRPAKPGSPRLRLTDNCIDLPRLVYLIEDSFGRKLDIQDYLKRVDDNLAGIIIAGEYEGAAILTWELPTGMSKETAHDTNRYVPYLDKFAVLKSQQGGSSVADIVFNAMVQDCFPGGVCWRSRKDNPVNKWYFERSTGTRQLTGSNWAMFWTTTDVKDRGSTLEDYESVCRGVEPSWADKKHVLD
ncbi:hypothetical protein EsDP_00002015 [Epichloe bromicola]|uniref:Amino-acid acetyltransferase, mitochondrial n=1 Tax=Epichloe bromicola TaxID=79588 RepID=A0ABQ0CJJ4_9HYPO